MRSSEHAKEPRRGSVENTSAFSMPSTSIDTVPGVSSCTRT